jgi:peptide-methionine (R)-S-oxide reductase
MIRERRPADINDCVTLLREIHARDKYPAVWPADAPRWLTPPAMLQAWIALDGPAVVGHVVLTGDDAHLDVYRALLGARAGAPLAEVKRLFVSGSARGSGLADGLLATAVAGARANGRHAVLETVADERRANRCYERAGWKRIGSVRAAWVDANGDHPLLHCYEWPTGNPAPDAGVLDSVNKIDKTDADWRAELPADKFAVLREAATERPFSGELYHNKETGMYACGACKAPLFSSDTKYESGSGWPSFFAPQDADNVELVTDRSHGTVRTEVRCTSCGSHLGHVFDDGPAPTGQRYCINSLALDFEPRSA